MASIQPPRTQYDRNITLRIIGGGPFVSFTFPIKPEDLQRVSPARVTTTQTLQGVYQDFGGLGVETITIQGHTGWRRIFSATNYDGFETFKALYNDVYTEYHSRIASNPDPESIQCILIDDLFEQVYRVSLDDFQASKTKSKPLLYYYTLRMTVKFTSDNDRQPTDYIQYTSSDIAQTVSQALQTASSISTATSQPRLYTVQSGDTLSAIAYLYYQDGTATGYMKIANANNIVSPYTIYPGQVLVIP